MTSINSIDAPLLYARRQCKGRALYVQPNGRFYIGRGYKVFASDHDGKSWEHIASLPAVLKRRAGGMSRLAARLLRFEVKALAVLADRTIIAANRDGVYYGGDTTGPMRPSHVVSDGRAPAPPMTLCVGSNDRVLWGEYNSRSHNNPVRIYVSDDGGQSFCVGHVFDKGSIAHVHGLRYDSALGDYWVFTGDFDTQPGIGRLSGDLKSFDWIAKGEQRYRAVDAFDFGDRLVYGTDTQFEPNAVMSIDKGTGVVRRVAELDGSCIYACRFGSLYALSTSVEPSTVNRCQQAGLWLSRDGEGWSRVLQAPKDRWHPTYFQFGSIVLPRGQSDREKILMSGQAVKKLDGSVLIAEFRKKTC